MQDEPAAFEVPTAVPTFTCEPCEATLPAGSTVQVTALFAPRIVPRAGRQLSADFLVDVPNQDALTTHVVSLMGRCFAEPFYVQPPEAVLARAIQTWRISDSALLSSTGRALDCASTTTASALVAPSSEDEAEVYELLFPTPAHTESIDASQSVAAAASPAGARGKPAISRENSRPAATPSQPASVHEVTIACIARDAVSTNWDATFGSAPAPALMAAALAPAAVVGSSSTAPPATGAKVAPPNAAAPATTKAGPAGGAAGSKGVAGANSAASAALAVACTFQVQFVIPHGQHAADVAPAPSAAESQRGATARSTTATQALATSPGHYFAVDAPSGTVAPGSKQVLTFKFTPPISPGSTRAPASGLQAQPSVGIAPRDIVLPGTWSVVEARITLSSPAPASMFVPPPSSSITKTVTLRLRGFVPSST